MLALDSIYKKISDILSSNTLPVYDVFFELLNEVSELLENEKTGASGYRPAASDGGVGGLLDFHKDELPVVVIPDFHARPYFLQNILNYKIFDDATVYEAIAEARLRLLSVGDILHTERGTRERWIAAEAEFNSEIFTGPAMSAEMLEGLSLWCALMELKKSYPDRVHILKGNHENILNETGGGDFAFRKLADEGEMCRCFVQEYYGDDILYLINCIEKSLPLYFFGKRCAVSHAEPMRVFSREELIDARLYSGVVKGLIWTNNGEAMPGSAAGTVSRLFESSVAAGENDVKKSGSVYVPEGYVSLGGHRPVTGNYKILQNGTYIQIHNPARQNIVFVRPERSINLESDILGVAI